MKRKVQHLQSLWDPYLHPTHTHTQGGGSALLTLLHLPSSLLLRGVVSVLSGPHLQIKHTGKLEVMHHILQQQELWDMCQGELAHQRQPRATTDRDLGQQEIGLGNKQTGTNEQTRQTAW